LYLLAARTVAVPSPADDRLGDNGLKASKVALPKTFTQPPCLNSAVKFFDEKRFLANAPHQLKFPLFAETRVDPDAPKGFWVGAPQQTNQTRRQCLIVKQNKGIGFAGNRQGTIWPECDGEMRKKPLQLRAENLAVKGMHVYGSDGLLWTASPIQRWWCAE